MRTIDRTQHDLLRLRNIGISAHVDAGKTTLTERILFISGNSHFCGQVDDGNTTTDFTPQEQARGITIQSAAVSCVWSDHFINLIDTPGHLDFTVEVERSMRALDSAVIVVCAKGGVQPQTRTVWKQADRNSLPRIIFVNKMDSVGADFHRVCEQIETTFKTKLAALQLPLSCGSEFVGVVDLLSRQAFVWRHSEGNNQSRLTVEDVPSGFETAVENARDRLVETIVETDDLLISRFLNGETISLDQLQSALRRACCALKIVPLLTGSAFNGIGVEPLLDAVCMYMPSPKDARIQHAFDRSGSKINVESKCNSQNPLAFAFKTSEDTHGSLVFLRVYCGEVRAGSYVFNSRLQRNERISRLVKLQGSRKINVDRLNVGDIGAAIGLKDTITGDTLCGSNESLAFEPLVTFSSVVSLAIEPDRKDDLEKMMSALQRMQKDDPSFQVSQNAETGQTLISGMGELHLEIKRELLSEMGIATRVGKPQVSYRETAGMLAEYDYLHRHQSGGPGQYARVSLRLEPGRRGSGVRFYRCHHWFCNTESVCSFD